MARVIHAPRGATLTCKSWQTEAAMRMIMNNLDPEVAELPEQLIVYGGTGKAARNWEAFDQIIATLKTLESDETLLVQSGKPVGVFKTHEDAPRVLIANSNLVPHWATWDYFRKLEAQGLIMYGQMTAGSWIYIATQGIVQGTYETLAAVSRTHFGASLKGRLTLSAGLGGMGGAQPLSITMNDGVAIIVEVDKERIQKRIASGYLDEWTDSLDEALQKADQAKQAGTPLSIGLLGNAADVYPEFVKRGIAPDVVTDQTSAHDELNGYVPNQVSYEEALKLREEDPERYKKLALDAMVVHVEAMLKLQEMGSHVFDYGNNIRGQALAHGLKNAFDIEGYVPKYIRPLFCEGKGPFRWVALSGDPEDIYKTDEVVLREFADDKLLVNWIHKAREKVQFQGLPARICWLGYGERARFALIINDMVKNGELSAPIVIGRDHHDTGSVASPNRETEAMKDGSEAIADWPLLNAMLNTASGATWVSIHHGGGVGIGYSIHSGQVIVADGTAEAARRIERVLTNDPGSGVVRHADAGYDIAIDTAKKKGIKIPGITI